jgi:hypothetical protein
MDPILDRFMERQWETATALAEESDLLNLVRLDPQRIVAEFRGDGLILGRDGRVSVSDRALIGFSFFDNYLREADPYRVVTWLAPREVWHPNVSFPQVCLGPISVATPLVDLIYRTFELIGYQNVTTNERDALNPAACQWARNNQGRLPIDARPLKRRRTQPCTDDIGVTL